MNNINGINNIGNTCYMNAGLQLIFNCTILTKFFLNNNFKSNILNSYKYLLYQYDENRLDPNIIKNIIGKKNKNFNNNDQNDSHEFLITLIDLLDEELKKEFKNTNKKILNIKYTNLLDILFNNRIISNIESIKTDESSKNTSYERIISLSLKDNIYESIADFQKSELLKNQWFSENEKKKIDINKYLNINKYSKYLIFHLKRLINTNLKSNKNVQFYKIIEFESTKYDLRSIVIHIGSGNGGHYVAVIKRNDKWYLCDDNVISNVNVDNYLNNGYIYLYSKLRLK